MDTDFRDENQFFRLRSKENGTKYALYPCKILLLLKFYASPALFYPKSSPENPCYLWINQSREEPTFSMDRVWRNLFIWLSTYCPGTDTTLKDINIV
jgi:hypothetical protein